MSNNIPDNTSNSTSRLQSSSSPRDIRQQPMSLHTQQQQPQQQLKPQLSGDNASSSLTHISTEAIGEEEEEEEQERQQGGLLTPQYASPSPLPPSSSSGFRKFSISESFNSLNNNNNYNQPPFEFGGRSYIGMAHRGSFSCNMSSPSVNAGVDVHEQTVSLANIGVVSSDSDEESQQQQQQRQRDVESFNDSYGSPILDLQLVDSITTPLIQTPQKSYVEDHDRSSSVSSFTDLESGSIRKPPRNHNTITTPTEKQHPKPSILHQVIIQPFTYLPAVFLGTLLNILDGLSYGMIMFPIGDAIFSSLGPSGLSMFYISCIVSQLIYSLGGSAFKSGIGSEMIEVTPFFHTMALAIASQMKSDSQDAIIATTITTYAVSSIVTGLVFFLLGKCKLGVLVGFFPRHILVGCIGGVGYFLVVTGIEVSSRLEGGLEYNWEIFKYLFFNYETLLQWTIPLFLAIILILIQHKYHNSLIVPLYFIAVFIIFHLIVALIPNWSLPQLRHSGWIFPAVEDNEPWYHFYTLYKFNLVNWWAILAQFPTMLALTFFGILHVPINVPALAVTVGMDQVDVDRELMAHGYSNFLSGLVGSIQNYLVYTNSVLFIRAGADARFAGVMLAIATAGVMMIGPSIIGYIPVCVVGALIYLLGYELLKEAVYDTWGRLKRIEYMTIIIIVVTMGAFDFVVGIFIGILLACLSFVVEAGRTPVVHGVYSGSVARSTVLRHPKQQEFLKDVGDQICIIKLQGTIFFGSIGGVEDVIRNKFEHERFNLNPIKFLIVDMKGVQSLDFSAAEGFRRILKLTKEFNTLLIISSVAEDGEIIKGLRDAGLFDNDNNNDKIELFNSLNHALEWCENTFLKTYKSIKKQQKSHHPNNHPYSIISARAVPKESSTSMFQSPSLSKYDLGTPRTTKVLQAATRTISDEQKIHKQYHQPDNSSFKVQPLPLIMVTFQGLSDKPVEFWKKLAPCFVKESIPANITFYESNNTQPQFFIVESGLIRSVIKFENEGRELHSSILPLVAFGNLVSDNNNNIPGDSSRQCIYTTVNDSVVWKLSKEKLESEMKKCGSSGQEIICELLRIESKLIRERFDSMTANLIISG
ncbi:uncharacterized protein J8A68_004220 [[Candida] subhashii]|uniref:STAS domain-containing protein n=1 Tax=[Candida] subhashii TaxID=561895 RepID=A0A8J5UVG3_9ASCO|nr:uncharacterized protein J8A68_004220 [[Candida] subhashii]KAG7662210.1 hypothetical protein J8A68_004220 [[Candida] subhashii]